MESQDPTVYSRRARARVALSMACRQLSDAARARVPTRSDSYVRPGEFAGHAAGLVDQATLVLELAVIAERERGTSWEDIGDALGISKQAAHGRFAAVLERWRGQLAEPWATSQGGIQSPQLPDGAEDPSGAAQRLDGWVIRHREPTDADPGEHPVSGDLPLASLAEQVSAALEELRTLQERERAAGATPAQRRIWFRRKAELFELLAGARPDDPAYADAAANARHQLVVLDADREPPE